MVRPDHHSANTDHHSTCSDHASGLLAAMDGRHLSLPYYKRETGQTVDRSCTFLSLFFSNYRPSIVKYILFGAFLSEINHAP